MGNGVFKNKGHSISIEAMGIGLQNAQNVYTKLLEMAISKSEIRADIDLNFCKSYYFFNECKYGGILLSKRKGRRN